MSDDKTYPWSEKTPKPKISNADQNGHSDARNGRSDINDVFSEDAEKQKGCPYYPSVTINLPASDRDALLAHIEEPSKRLDAMQRKLDQRGRDLVEAVEDMRLNTKTRKAIRERHPELFKGE